MVRRRTRPAKFSADGCSSANVALLAQSLEGAVAFSDGRIVEDQYFASPKRKDCKIDEQAIVKRNAGAKEKKLSESSAKTRKSPVPGKGRLERGGINGRTIGVPLATRSQTRTIENFFKAKTAAKSSKIKAEYIDQDCIETDCKQTANNYNNTNNNDEKYAFPIMLHASSNGCASTQLASAPPPPLPSMQRQTSLDGSRAASAPKIQEHLIFDLSEDTTDTDNTELSDEYSILSGGGAPHVVPLNNISNFSTHRPLMHGGGGDSNSSRSSITDNIFLQEPVLSLNVDKSPNQASSIKINKTLEIEPIFSSPPSISAALLNGRFNKIVSLQGSPVTLRGSFCFETQLLNHQQPDQPAVDNGSCDVLSSEHDNSSCDSGVALSTATSTKTLVDTEHPQPLSESEAVTAATPRRRKPATPHRIVCPSPIKTAPRVVSPACGGGGDSTASNTSSPSGRKLAASKDQLSPRKSHRHQAQTAGPKTRRKLHQPKEHQAPYHSTTTSNATGYNQISKKNNHHIDSVEHHIKNEPDDQQLENLQILADVVEIVGASSFAHTASKSILNATTEQQQQLKDSTKKGDHKISTTAKASTNKHSQKDRPKIKSHQTSHSQPLAATNGNRELTEFFPVRRSVRKTKTAVKEEMMRNLEQAILKNHGDGLKVAHFENKGRGVIAERRFQRGEFVVEYVGDLISMTEAAKREKQYALDENAGCYMYYFKHKNQQYCIDATADTGELGRLVNHSRTGNLITKVVVVKQRPHLILLAKEDIEAGEELTYDYGDRSKESLLHHPWLAF